MQKKILFVLLGGLIALTNMNLSTTVCAEPSISDWNFGHVNIQTDSGVKAYQLIRKAFLELDFDVRFTPADGVTYDDCFNACISRLQNDPELFFLADVLVQSYGTNGARFDVTLYVPGKEGAQPPTEENIAILRDALAKLDETSNKIIADMPENLITDYEKSLYLHDYVVLNTDYKMSIDADYNKTMDDQSAYSCLVEGKCICQGYASGLVLLLRKAGIPAWVVNGIADGDMHAWVIEWLDGECVYTDPTWDDTLAKRDGVEIIHDYVHLSLEKMSEDHAPYEYFKLPECGHTGHEYKSQTTNLMGDLNCDNEFNIADVVLLQKWLLAYPGVEIQNWSAADFCTDEILNVFDLCLMKHALIKKMEASNNILEVYDVNTGDLIADELIINLVEFVTIKTIDGNRRETINDKSYSTADGNPIILKSDASNVIDYNFVIRDIESVNGDKYYKYIEEQTEKSGNITRIYVNCKFD